MLKYLLIFLFAAVAILSFRSQSPEPWTKDQLLEPAELARIIRDSTARQPILICVGPGALIQHSIDAGPARDQANLQKLRDQLARVSKDATVVIYCGCCPFDRCPNIRPAFRLLNEMKFSHARLLNLATNLKVDWINKGYPSTQ